MKKNMKRKAMALILCLLLALGATTIAHAAAYQPSARLELVGASGSQWRCHAQAYSDSDNSWIQAVLICTDGRTVTSELVYGNQGEMIHAYTPGLVAAVSTLTATYRCG